ncbi:MAG: phosphate transport system substrate-binding protein [Paracoccaceae bacterium]|jgi:phosphate transport system substrate-binding protein
MLFARLARLAAGVAAISVVATAASAEIVTLKSYDGNVALTGDLTRFENNTYFLRTLIGEIAVNATQVSCDGEACPEIELGSAFSIKGSDTIGAGLMPALLLGFADQIDADVVQSRGATEGAMSMQMLAASGDELAKIELDVGGSAGGITALLANDVAIAMASRALSDDEIDNFAAVGFPDMATPQREQVLALDGLVVITSPSNPVESLSVIEIAEIFAGDITNWNEVGGPDLPIEIFAHEDGAGTMGELNSQILRPNGAALSPNARRFSGNEVLADEVSVTRGAIGFTGLAYVRSAKALAVRTECGLVATPSSFAIKTEEYPLARRLYLYTSGAPQPAQVARLLDYTRSEDAQQVIADAGFVDQGVDHIPVNDQGVRFAMAFTDPSPEFNFPQMRELMGELINGQRLSTTFRFLPGSSQLDNKAQGDVERIVKYLMAEDEKGAEVLLVGFTDSVGRADLNRALSFRRADQVRRAIVDAGGQTLLDQVNIRVLGYGELAPVGCNETLLGRSINRRVEMWITNGE